MPSRNYTLFFFLSIGLVLVCIAFITILGQTDKKDTGNADIRAKASVSNSLQLVGIISDIDSTNQVLSVDQVKFENKSSEPDSMGLWKMSVPRDYKILSIPVGKKIYINVDAATFNVTQKTMVALAISS